MKENIRNFIRDWLSKANEDYLTIQRLTDGDVIATSSICFHCQQLVEKYLKAYLIAKGREIKKTHNIEFLLAECADFDITFNEIEPGDLSDFGVDIRYPGDIYIPSEKEALEYKELAIKIKIFVTNKLEPLLNN